MKEWFTAHGCCKITGLGVYYFRDPPVYPKKERSTIPLRFALLYGCCLSTVVVSAQNLRSQNDTLDLFFSRHHLSLQLQGGVSQKGHFVQNTAAYRTSSHAQAYVEAGLLRSLNISRRFSLQFGAAAAFIIRNFEYRIPGTAFNPPFDDEVFNNKGPSRSGSLVLRLPLMAEYRFFHRSAFYWAPQAGFSLVYAFLNEEEHTHIVLLNNGQQVRYFYMLLDPNNKRRPFLNYHAGLSFNRMLPHNHILSFRLLAGLSLTRFVKGNYAFTIPGQPDVRGEYSVKGSYLSLGANYTFTGLRKTIKAGAAQKNR